MTAAGQRRDFFAAAALLALALAVGGAGVRFPLLEGAVEAAAILVLAYLAATARWRAIPGALLPTMLIGFGLLLGLVQLLPLPPEIWQGLPGRALLARISAAAGLGEAWRPLSLDPEATRRALLALLPGAAMFWATLRLGADARLQLARITIGFALLGLLLGALQLASGNGAGVTPYPSAHSGSALGLFTNRNHHADFLMIAMLLAAGVGMAGRKKGARMPAVDRRWIAGGLIALFALGTIGTSSRMGLLILAPVLAVALLILFHGRIRPRPLMIGVGAVAVLAALALQSAPGQRVLNRFSWEDARQAIWSDTLWALPKYQPWGAGYGGFVPVFKAAESLDGLGRPLINHAHNDYLEIALEAGWPGMALVAGFLLFMGLGARRLASGRIGREERLAGWAALAGIAVTLLHSLVDYPLRMLALTTLFGMLCALLIPAGRAEERPARRRPVVLGLGALAGLLLLAQAGGAALSARALRGGDADAATAWSPWSSRAWSARADDLLERGDAQGAAEAARRALAISPIDGRAIRVLGLVEEANGRREAAEHLMTAGGALGWRDRPTQLWLVRESLAAGDAAVAMQRMDALLRQAGDAGDLLAALRALAVQDDVRAELAARLVTRPPWRVPFFSGARRLPPDQAAAHERLLLALAAGSAPPDRHEVRPFVADLVAQGEARRAHALWRRTTGADAGLSDGGFDAASAERGRQSPFEWRPTRLPGAVVSFAVPDAPVDGRAMRVRTDGIASGSAVEQMLLLPPGHYALTYRARGEEPGALAGFGWTLACGAAPPGPVTVRDDGAPGWRTARGAVSIGVGCAVQRLALGTVRATGRPGAIWVDQVALKPLR